MELAVALLLITSFIAFMAFTVGKVICRPSTSPIIVKILPKESKLVELRELSNKLVETEAELSAFFHLAPIMFFIASNNGYFVKVNPEVTKEFGWSPEEFTSLPWLHFVHPDDVEKTANAAKDIANQKLKNFENRYRCKDGSYKTVSWLSSVFFRDKAFCIAAIIKNESEAT